jgi:RNA polymerase sigma-70 factor, ECF subfamily
MEQSTPQEAVFSEEDQIIWAQKSNTHFEPLYDRYYHKIFRFIYQRMESRDDAADITADVFLKAMTAIGGYKIGATPFASWLFAIARNEVAGFYRRKKIEHRYYASLEGISQLAADAEYEVPDSYFSVRKALELLPDKDFELIDLKYFNYKSIREISDITGINESNIRVRLHRIRERIAKMVHSKPTDILTLITSICIAWHCLVAMIG